ncbi:MAG: hypothetical protein CL694_09620 [Chloroflexi bacterium]|jgi:archaellin|nr:hypothetical protein [Chloroflexota bacterium]MDP6421752.1 hypothetical protein [SAR202 cluster bacterium]MQG59185.1 hypothetical protein [SAR202 cluster bacterium]|tara:strand:- start:604 stop:1656 length:1053 start_codon:yes stop_codon:yes gene_type:complete
MNLLREYRALARQERGVTVLETAIIMIAFVVVASVFAFTVLSSGIFAAERGKETIHAGLKGARSSLEVKGSVVATGITNQTLSLANSAWTGSSNVTSTADLVDKKEGTASADLLIAAGFTTGLVAYEDLSATVDLSSLNAIKLWVKYGTTTVAGDLELVLDDTAGCGSPLENIDLPAQGGGAWKKVSVAIADNDDMTAVACVGLNSTTDYGSQTANLDQIIAQGQASTLFVVLSNALEGEPIDVEEPSDSDNNGLSDPDSTHTMILSYSDKNQTVSDVYWTRTFTGENDEDDLLEAGEKIEVTVTLSGLAAAYPVVGDTKFDLEVRPESGGSIVIQRTMPDVIDTAMNLN